MTFACVLSALLIIAGQPLPVITWALAIVVVGCVITIIRRTLLVIAALESK
jgi:hypothetical protein